ncbi:diaminopimelate epimerase [Capsulimonas corticalis]|uniref:Diaminopimelate epimerase n=1 Tax=Capsulimonas corticalis TaxID=2219043 RepID=A0A402CZU0_9BACT|nr:diaminopimelate epimerase [Capsulimonas corticalis]BDI33858.1 diaminopimelate epimerase [Capsulimonas corticalis]
MRFTKMQGVGNDFVVIDASAFPQDGDLAALSLQVCERRFGIGADGLLVVGQSNSKATPVTMRMFNPDGSEDMCGNGLRCAGLWAFARGWTAGEREFSVATKEGVRNVRVLESDAEARHGQLTVDMGLPRFASEEIPFCGPTGAPVRNFPLTIDGETFSIHSVNTGSTHTVIFGDEADDARFTRFSPIIEEHPLFPERTSVQWAVPNGDCAIEVRIWERGVGETLGCGTGACAVAVAAKRQGVVPMDAESIDIRSKGGVLRIAWAGEGAAIAMTGPADVVFEGEITID